jgi:hypothetical protein
LYISLCVCIYFHFSWVSILCPNIYLTLYKTAKTLPKVIVLTLLPIRRKQEFYLFHILAKTGVCNSLFLLKSFQWVCKGILSWVLFAFSWWLMMMNISSQAFWLLIYCILWCVYLNILLIFTQVICLAIVTNTFWKFFFLTSMNKVISNFEITNKLILK